MNAHGLLSTLLALITANSLHAQIQSEPTLADKAVAILEKHCYRCHGQNGAKEGGFDDVMDVKSLRERRKVVAGDAGKSRLFRRVSEGDMPPQGEKPRPGEADIALLKQWIDAGAPQPIVSARERHFVTTNEVLQALRDHLEKTEVSARPFQRYFSLTHLHNLKKVKDRDLPLYRAALSKLVNSLSWKSEIAVPRPIDAAQTIFALDLRELDWAQHDLWHEILKRYPYGLKHDRDPNDEATRQLARQVYELCGSELPVIRADWFIAVASRPPLYHTLLRLPEQAEQLEKTLEVDAATNFHNNRLARAGFANSGVSSQNRVVERHKALFGAYWKSYDFKSKQGKSSLFQFPLGPLVDDHPFPQLAFQHDGGEIIFNLPNGLQGYLLVDGKGGRIDEAPIEVVSDQLKTAGTPAIVNGLSCMACHAHGMIGLKDTLRNGSAAAGAALEKLRSLHPLPDEMDKMLAEDEQRFLQALDKATGVFLRPGDDKTDIKLFPETIGPIARWYRLQDLGPEEIAAELGLKNVTVLQDAISTNRRLREIGLGPLAAGDSIKRESWESLQTFVSPFQETARIMQVGSPKRFH